MDRIKQAAKFRSEYQTTGEPLNLKEEDKILKALPGLSSEDNLSNTVQLQVLNNLLNRLLALGPPNEDVENEILKTQRLLDSGKMEEDDRINALITISALELLLFGEDKREDRLKIVDSTLQEALTLAKDSPPAAVILRYQGHLRLTYFLITDSQQDLDLAHQLYKDSAQHRHCSTEERLSSLTAIGDLLLTSHHHNGSIQDLEGSISTFSQVLSDAKDLKTEGKVVHYRDALTNLGRALASKYSSQRLRVDLESAYKLLKEAYKCYRNVTASYQKAACMSLYANLQMALFEVTGNSMRCLDSRMLHQEALEMIKPVNFRHVELLAGLSYSSFLCYKQGVDIETTSHEAINHALTAVNIYTHRDARRAILLYEAAHRLFSCSEGFGRTLSKDHLFKAIGFLEEASQIRLEKGIPRVASYMVLHAVILLEANHDEERAFEMLKNATYLENNTPRQTFDSALAWATWADSCNRADVREAYDTAMQALVEYLSSYSSVQAYMDLLHHHAVSDLLSGVVSCALRDNSPTEAIVYFHTGTSIILSMLQQFRHPVDELRRAGHQELAKELAETGEKLHKISIESDSRAPPIASLVLNGPSISPETSGRVPQKDYKDLKAKWESILDEIRSIPQFSEYMERPTIKELQKAAEEGPILMLNIAKDRSDFLILTNDKTNPCSVVNLQEVDQKWVSQLSRDFRDASDPEVENVPKPLEKCLDDLWHKICKPVMMQLANVVPQDVKKPEAGKPAQRPRIWWCPGHGAIGLPLHAAYESVSLSADGTYKSSYTMSLTSLIRARIESAGRPLGKIGLLVVAVGKQQGDFPEIESVRHEENSSL